MRRWWRERSLGTKSLTLLAVPLVPLVVSAVLFVQSGVRTREATELVAHTLAVKAQIATVSSLMIDAEAGVRGYLLTRSAESMDVYETATASLRPATARLAELVANNADQVTQLRRISELAAQRPLSRMLDYAERTGPGAPPPLDLLADSRSTMAALRNELAAMQDVEDRLLVTRTTAASTAQQREIVVGATAGVLALVAGLFAAVMLRRWTAKVEEARDEIDRFFSLSLDLLCIASPDGRFVRINPVWTTVLGWTEQELTSRPFIEFVHPDDRDATAAAAARLAENTRVVDFENRYRSKDGTFRWLNWRAAPAPNGFIYAAARDVTEQKQTARELENRAEALAAASEALETARQEAERANRAKSDFLSRMSHDLRTPLNAILGFAQLLATEETDADRSEYARQILSGGRHLLELINEVLDIARIEAGQLSLSPEPVNVPDVAREVLDLVAPLATVREVSLRLADRPCNDVPVIADRQRLAQILLNLVSNAVKYTSRGGRVTIECVAQPARRLRILVIDTGAGIPPEKLRLLFTPFERIGAENSAVEGTGLGLALSRGLSSAMGGTMGVESEVDRGTTFWLELPMSDRKPAIAHEVSEPAAAAAVRRDVAGTVLYVEDNLSNVRLMERVLKRRPGVTLLHAPAGAAGIDMARQHRPSAIFLDLHLPDVSGEEVLRQLWEDPDLRPIPVAVLSADAMSAQMRRLKAGGAVAYLTKPLDVGKLLGLVDQFLAGSQA
jgi:PAS domain S-box-containing protein